MANLNCASRIHMPFSLVMTCTGQWDNCTEACLNPMVPTSMAQIETIDATDSDS